MIADILNCTNNEYRKKRWNSLRNQFSRKLRQQKNQPSGSRTWPLMSCMPFLTPHIQNRKYVYLNEQEVHLQRSSSRYSETSSSCLFDSPVQSPSTSYARPVLCINYEYFSLNADHNTLLNKDIITLLFFSFFLDCLSNSSTEIITRPELCIDVTKENEKIRNNSETPKTHTKRILVPSLDNFAKKKKAANDYLEDLLNKSSLPT
ncbi:hypothetical protein P5V15_006928 [Pogonomyrmex californicus]